MKMKLWPVLLALVLSHCLCHVHGLQKYNVSINTEQTIQTLNDRFLSIAIDFGIIYRGVKYNLLHPRLLTLTKALAPAFLRLGGTAEDFMTFRPNAEEPNEVLSFQTSNYTNLLVEDLVKRNVDPFYMTGKQLDEIIAFKSQANMDLFIGLNVLKRDGKNWDPSNAMVLMNYLAERNVMVHWQLGNEPPFRKFNVTLEPSQLVHDFQRLFILKNTFSMFRNSLLVGPDIGQFRGKTYKMVYYDRFIRHTVPILNAVTWHMYYLNGRTAKLADFINSTILNKLRPEIDLITKLTRNYSPSLAIWLGETSSTYGGGTQGLSDRYIAGFMWLDKLGLSARKGIKLVIRQSLIGGHYSLIDGENDFQPRPDYWLSLLYKKILGPKVLNVTVTSAKTENVRVYAHCVNEEITGYTKGTVVVYALNLLEEEIEISVITAPTRIIIDQYVLTPENNNLTSKNVLLNGRKLQMPDEITLPDLSPLTTDGIRVPGLSFGFFVVRHFVADTCV